MLSLFDRVSIERALALPLDVKLRQLLATRVANLVTADFDLTDMTNFLIVEPGGTEAEIKEEIGLSPLVNPIDGARYGAGDFQPYWDWLEDHDGWFELIVTVGNSGFAYVLLVQDADGVDVDLLALCRHYAGEQSQ